MPVDVKIYDTDTLLGVMEQVEPVSSYWLDLCFPNQVNFDTQYVDFEKVTNIRKLAPFVAPTAQGRPIYSKGGSVTRFEPAYVKPKDPVSPDRQIKKKPGSLLSKAPSSPEARYNAQIADILRTHREAIDRRSEWMAAQAILTGSITIADEGYPERIVSFQRDAGHTITLGSGTYWTTSSDILGQLESWRTTMRRAKFGGAPNRVTFGPDAWDMFRKNADVQKQLDTQVRGTDAAFRTGMRQGLDVEYMGNIGGLDLYVYNDYYQANDGSVVPFMSSKDVVLTGPNVQGTRCFGAILDQAAQLRALPIFSKMWHENDPSNTFVMSQSAPLMVPVNPNATLKATVLA